MGRLLFGWVNKFRHSEVGLVDKKNRIIFKCMDDGVILFVNIGVHAIYEDMGL